MSGSLTASVRSALFLTATLAMLPGSAPVLAEEDTAVSVETRHGAVSGWRDVEVEGGLTSIAQGASDGDADAELTVSVDLVATLPAGPGKIVMYVEGNTSPAGSGVSALFAEANADAGTALDRDGNGRLQVSELHYAQALNSHGIAVAGLLDPTTSLDTSHLANDETSQFLTTSLVNNPSIEFPDYTLGGIYNHELSDTTALTFMLTSSHGLGDNSDASYAQLVDVTEDGKGVFAAAETQWVSAALAVRTGVWLNSADHAELDGAGDSEDNYGIYGVVDGSLAGGLWSLRVGLANEAVSPTAAFASFAIEHPVAGVAIGAGVARSWLSDDAQAPDLDDATQVELYARYQPREDLSLTPSLQWLENSGFDASDTVVDETALVYGMRVNFLF